MNSSELSRRAFLSAAGLAAGSVAIQQASPAFGQLQPRRRPNIVLITADDLGYGDLSGYGRADFQTPVLDRLASQGTRFTHAYSIAPICTPTRVGLMTGRYPSRHPVGLREPLTGGPRDREMGLEPSHPTLSSLLKKAGYTNGLFGKWHLGFLPEFHPLRHGFDQFFGPLSGAIDYVSHTDPVGTRDLYRNFEPVHASGYITDLIANEAVDFIREAKEPFFLSHQGTAPHSPWQRRGDPPLKPPGMASRGMVVGPKDRFPAMMQALDEAVGRILAALEETGAAERTLVIFTSDNGGNDLSSMGGLDGSKGSLREGGIRVPAFARWPAVVPAGITTWQVASTLDWTATMLSAAGAMPAATHPLDGLDLLPLLSRQPVERTIYWRKVLGNPQGAVRSGGWKYLREGDKEYLFDLVLDSGERRDLKIEQRDKFEALRAAYAEWEKKMLPPPS